MSARPVIPCAIYTRKSSDEGLHQDFNALDAQHEACAAFIASQKQEGWKPVAARYDDGGLSGGTLNRPALQRLLADIDAGKVRMVVVYKIDRLTRSLADFARLVERFDRSGCSFVSVTQAFNTATSMGRLTLNVLLSFAQFEREVTAERIRDKIAASKKKGLWMGGMPPLGYDPHPDPRARTLVINPAEADDVRSLFDLYRHHGCLRQVEIAAQTAGIRSKVRRFANGRRSGGTTLSRGQIHKILTNPVYVGHIRHKDQIHPGLHEAIITKDLWDAVQTLLREASRRPRGRRRKNGDQADVASTLFLGKLHDETGDRLTPTHARKGERRISYYVSRRLLRDGPCEHGTGWRLPAAQVDAMLVRMITDHLERAAARHRIVQSSDVAAIGTSAAKMMAIIDRVRADPSATAALVERAVIVPGSLTVDLDRAALAADLDTTPDALEPGLLTLTTPFHRKRRGIETRIVAGDWHPEPDPVLTKALAHAHRWLDALHAGQTLSHIARTQHCTQAFIRTRLQLAFLSPAIQQAIMDGTQPATLTLEKIVRTGVPLDWSEQARTFDFKA